MKQTYIKSFGISGLNLLLDSDVEIISNDEFVGFESKENTGYRIVLREVPILKNINNNLIAESTGFRVYSDKPGNIYKYYDIGNNPYAISTVDWTDKIVSIQYLKNGIKHISHARGAFFHIRWEELLLNENRLILHACCVETTYGGILFSGVSGVGKSTQGNLWCRYEDAKMINGDRPILYKEGKWYAYGSPYAGSSKCHVNERTKIRAIVLLSQSKQCSIRKLRKSEAFRNIFAQLTIAAWNPESVQHACELVEQLINDVPVYAMACTPDREAVDLLKATIEEEV